MPDLTEDVVKTDVEIDANGVSLAGILTQPRQASAIIVFAHGSGSSRFSPRNQQIAESFNSSGFATLLFDLLTAAENEVDQFTREHRFNIHLLAERLEGTIDWLQSQRTLSPMKLGLFGASTGAAAALIAAAHRPAMVNAVVSRGGRPDLAAEELAHVRAPTLLLVGGRDDVVITLNRAAAAQISGDCSLHIVPGATHLFEEEGKLEEVFRLARNWFEQYLLADN